MEAQSNDRPGGLGETAHHGKPEDVRIQLNGQPQRSWSDRALGEDPTEEWEPGTRLDACVEVDDHKVAHCAQSLLARRILILDADDRVRTSAARAITRRDEFMNASKRILFFKDTTGHVSLESLIDFVSPREHGTLISVDAGTIRADPFLQHLGWFTPEHVARLIVQAERHRCFILIAASTERLRRVPVEAWKDEGRRVTIEVKKEMARDVTEPQGDLTGATGLLASGTPLEKMVLFVAAFFPRIPAEEFQEVLLLLLGDRAAGVDTGAPTRQGPAGDDAASTAPAPIPLRALWERDRQEIVKHCNLTYQSVSSSLRGGDQSSYRSLTFASQLIEREVRDYFWNNDYLFLAEQFDRIWNLGLLFRSRSTVLEATIRMSGDMAMQHPERYGRPSLIDIVQRATVAMGQAEMATALRSELKQVITRLNTQLQWNFVLDRAALLLRELMQRPGLAAVDRDLLNDLFAHGLEEAALGLVVRLQGARGFDDLHWIRRLIEDESQSVQEAAQRHLWALFSEDAPCARDLLVRVGGWLSAEAGSGGRCRSAAASLIVNLCEQSLCDPWASRSIVLDILFHPDALLAIDQFEPWLFHPAVSQELRSRLARHINGFMPHLLGLTDLRAEIGDGGEALITRLQAQWNRVLAGVWQRAGVEGAPWRGLFPALCLTHWSMRMRGTASDDGPEEAPSASAATAFDRLLALCAEGGTRDSRRRGADLVTYLEAMAETVNLGLEALSAAPIARTPKRRRDKRAMRERLQRIRAHLRATASRIAPSSHTFIVST